MFDSHTPGPRHTEDKETAEEGGLETFSNVPCTHSDSESCPLAEQELSKKLLQLLQNGLNKL